jgi:hypothetical protein
MAVILGRFVDRSHYECEHRFRFVTAPVHPATLALLAHWHDCQARGGMRMGRDIPARGIAALMKHLIVSEPIGDWEDAHLRLVGSGMAEHFGRDVTGLTMNEVFAGDLSDRDMLLAGAKTCIASNRPGTVEQTLLDQGKEVLRQEMTAMPLLAPNGGEHWLLTATFNF